MKNEWKFSRRQDVGVFAWGKGFDQGKIKTCLDQEAPWENFGVIGQVTFRDEGRRGFGRLFLRWRRMRGCL